MDRSSLNWPLALTRTFGMPSDDSSQLSWIQVRGAKLAPTIVSRPPGTATPEADSFGPAAPADKNGRSRTGMRRMIGIVAAMSRSRCGRRVGGVGIGACPSIQRVPSQNVNVVSHSATRLAQRAPWLCGPASRRVCYFVGRSAKAPERGDTRGPIVDSHEPPRNFLNSPDTGPPMCPPCARATS
jgi:hypothetical protein